MGPVRRHVRALFRPARQAGRSASVLQRLVFRVIRRDPVEAVDNRRISQGLSVVSSRKGRSKQQLPGREKRTPKAFGVKSPVLSALGFNRNVGWRDCESQRSPAPWIQPCRRCVATSRDCIESGFYRKSGQVSDFFHNRQILQSPVLNRGGCREDGGWRMANGQCRSRDRRYRSPDAFCPPPGVARRSPDAYWRVLQGALSAVRRALSVAGPDLSFAESTLSVAGRLPDVRAVLGITEGAVARRNGISRAAQSPLGSAQ